VKNNSNGKIARRLAAGLALISIAAWAFGPFNGGQRAPGQDLALDSYQSELQYHYQHLPVGHVETLFARR